MSAPRLLRAFAVDDEPSILATFRRAFHRDFQLATECDPLRALAQLQACEFDVLFVDYAMPGMNGVAFLERVRRMRPDLPAFLVTAHAPSAATQDAIARGLASAVIPKPWTRQDILHRVDALLPTSPR
ncbi:MAG: response regulator [Kofleriaceae bacterium]